MSFFEDASLVLIPSAQKTSKVYSVKPTDGTGDLTFTRTGDTASRVASNGLIEKVRTNLLTYSEDWTNAAWTKTNATVTANATTNPIDGASTADAIFETTTNGQHNFFQLCSVTVGTEVTISFYAKANGRTKLRMNNGSSAITAAFDLSAVTASMLAGTGTPNITSVGSGWYRCSLRYNALNASEYLAMNFRDDTDQDTYAGDITKGMFFFGGQAETGVLTDYIATTTAAVSVGPVANVPRLDYLGSSCPRLLLEPQRTNLVLFSEQIDNAAWNKETGNTVVANSVVSPDGYTNADSISATSGNVLNVNQSLPTPASTAIYTFSGFFKKQSISSVEIYLFQVGGGFVARASLNLDAGTITASVGTATITNYGNGWYRASVTGTLTGSIISTCGIFNESTTGTRNVYAYGCQVEASASYPTSYVPTLGAAVTRGADVCSKSGISSILPTQTGTLYVEFDWQKTPADVQVMSIHNNSDGLAWINKSTTTNLQGTYFASGYIGSINGTVSASAGIVKVAYAWTNGRQALYINGVQAGTDTAAITDSNDFGFFEFNGFWGIQKNGTSVASALVFPTALSNSDLAALTA